MPRYHALIPAAGTGTRIGGGTPKQYLRLAGKSMLSHSINALLAERRIAAVTVIVSGTDRQWVAIDPEVAMPTRVEFLPLGGRTRFDSVRAGVEALASGAAADDWVLVHDAARPCLSAAEVAALIDALRDDEVGGLLALPIADTVKRERAGHATAPRVAQTVPRNGLWRALTPQMFRLSVLQRACAAVTGEADAPTDEAMAIERLGLQPRLVPGSASNIKVTHDADLALAEAILRARVAPNHGGRPA